MENEFHKGYVEYKGSQLAEFRSQMESQSVLQQYARSHSRIINFDTSSIPIKEVFCDLLVSKGVAPRDANLGKLHDALDSGAQGFSDHGQTDLGKMFFETNEEFRRCYLGLIREISRKVFGAMPMFYQAVPHFRFCFPNSKGATWQNDGLYHWDLACGHPPQEINVWIPLTETEGSNSLSFAPVEASLNILRRCDYSFIEFSKKIDGEKGFYEHCHEINSQPVRMKYGQALIYDSRCLHGGFKNKTDRTRISFDFRILPIGEVKEAGKYRSTGPKRLRFAPGEFFAKEPVQPHVDFPAPHLPKANHIGSSPDR